MTVYFYSQKWYPIPYEWARLLKVLLATVVALAVAWGIGRALGESVYSPLNELALKTLATAPAVLLFPLALWATRYFTPGERRKLAGAARRLTGRPAARVAGPAPSDPRARSPWLRVRTTAARSASPSRTPSTAPRT